MLLFSSFLAALPCQPTWLHTKIRTQRTNCRKLFREAFLPVNAPIKNQVRPESNLLVHFDIFDRIHAESVYFHLIGAPSFPLQRARVSTPSN